MADEQIIYLSPEEELTNVRERLEQAPARRIILVIPPQTHLRSHVGWRVLHARMRELGKEVLIISSDRQIRAVAKAVGFRVADSLESPTSNRSRPPSRPGRTTVGGKTSSRSRSAPPKGTTQSPAPLQRQQLSQRNLDQQLAQQPPRDAESKISSAGEAITGKGADFASSTFGAGDYEGQDDHEDRPYWAGREGYEFHIKTSPPVSPRIPAHDDEEFPDPLMDQYNQAQFIRQQFHAEDPAPDRPASTAGTGDHEGRPYGRQAGRKGDDALVSPHDRRDLQGSAPNSAAAFQSRQPGFGQGDEDPYAGYMEDIYPVLLPEQRASAPVEDIDAGVPDISDIPTDILDGQIEDLGDEGDILIQPPLAPARGATTFQDAQAGREEWDEPIPEEPERPFPPRIYGSRRSGNLRPPQLLPEPVIDDEDMLAPAADRPPSAKPPSPVRRSGTLTPAVTSNRGPQPVIPPQTRTGQAKPAPQQAKKPAKKGRTVTTSPQGKKPAAAAQIPAQRRNNRRTLIVFLCLVAVFLILIGLFYFLPGAQITISLPSRPLTVGPLHFSASTNAQDKAHNTVPSVVLSYDKSVPGQGNATGTSQVGNAPAKGNVNFTNKGTQSIDIPTGIVLSTSDGIQFATTADALITQAGSNSPPVPVQAVKAGNNSNVAAGSITVIPGDSLKKIAQYNNVPASSLNLSVTNPQALTGGGTSPATSVTASDIQTVKTTLNNELQADMQTWLAQHVHKGDIQGTPVQSETVTTTPAAGQVTNDGKFSETLLLHMTILVVRAGALEAAATAQLNTMALKMHPAYMLVADQPVTFSKIQSSAAKDGNSISISLNATGQIMQQVSVEVIRSTLAGKTIDQAKSDITNGLGGLHGVLNTPTIQVSPGFLTILPFRADHITIILKAVPTTTPTKGVPNG